jgi:cobalt/nickel transport system permease protein
MHIMDGYLPLTHAVAWTAASAPFVVTGYRALRRTVGSDGRFVLATAAAFTLLLSSLKLPSVAGSSSHPTGTALGTMLAGAPVMSVVALLVLLFQALLLAHGGLTTLGANVFSMGVVGPWSALITYRLLMRGGLPSALTIGVAAFVGDMSTYVTTSFQLALAHPEAGASIGAAFLRFLGIFSFTQVPIALLEGVLTVLVFRALPTVSRGGLSTTGTPSAHAV